MLTENQEVNCMHMHFGEVLFPICSKRSTDTPDISYMPNVPQK